MSHDYFIAQEGLIQEALGNPDTLVLRTVLGQLHPNVSN
jgi:hypothetical protein